VSKSCTNAQETTEASTGGITATDAPASGDSPVNIQESTATEAVPAPTDIDVAVQDSQDTTVDDGIIQDTPTEVQDNTQDVTVNDDQECNTQEVTGMASITEIVDKISTSDNQEVANVQSPTIVVQEAEQGNTQEPTTTIEPVAEPDFISDLPTVQDEIQTPDPTLQPSITTGR